MRKIESTNIFCESFLFCFVKALSDRSAIYHIFSDRKFFTLLHN
jgi:hypothetical protein